MKPFCLVVKHRGLLNAGLDADLLDVCQAQKPAGRRAAHHCSIRAKGVFCRRPYKMATCLHTPISLGLLIIPCCECSSAVLCETQAVVSGHSWGHATCLAAEQAVHCMDSASRSFVLSSQLHHFCMLHVVSMPWCMQIYPITMASWIFGRKRPSSVNALAVLDRSGVDVTSVVNLK